MRSVVMLFGLSNIVLMTNIGYDVITVIRITYSDDGELDGANSTIN